MTREALHEWAVPWVEGEESVSFEPLVLSALQHLHGFDLLCRDPSRPNVVRHGATGEGEWVHSLGDISEGLARWQRACELHDADPQGWSRMAMEQARAFARAEEEARAAHPPAADRPDKP